ncbi:MAG: hypothetical protein ACOC6F_00240 [bacterium]
MPSWLTHLLTYIGGLGTFGAAVGWALRNPAKVERIGALLYRVLAWFHHKFEYGKVATSIQATVNTAGENLTKEAGNVLPHAMKIKWARKTQEAEAFLRDGEILVTMAPSQNQDRNLVVSTLVYLGEGLMPRARSYIDVTLMKAIDFTLARRIFQSATSGLPIPYFFSNHLEPAIERQPELRSACTLMDNLEQAGFFTRILLPQLQRAGHKVYPATPDQNTRRETHDFAQFLETIATKQKGEDVPEGLTFPGSRIRTNILLIARPKTKRWGTQPYTRRIQIERDKGVEYVYICARTPDNIELAEEVAQEQESAGGLDILKRYHYEQPVNGTRLAAVCIVCALNRLTQQSVPSGPETILHRLIKDTIPEIQSRQLEVVTIARQEGIRSKVAVRSLVEGVDAVACCNEYRKQLQSQLAGEAIQFIPWTSDPTAFIVAALNPLASADIVGIDIDQDDRTALVAVDGWKPRRKALGRGDFNLECAMDLTGWEIIVEDISDT